MLADTLYGVSPSAPRARLSAMGAGFLVSLRGHRVVAVDHHAIEMVTLTSARPKVYHVEADSDAVLARTLCGKLHNNAQYQHLRPADLSEFCDQYAHTRARDQEFPHQYARVRARGLAPISGHARKYGQTSWISSKPRQRRSSPEMQMPGQTSMLFVLLWRESTPTSLRHSIARSTKRSGGRRRRAMLAAIPEFGRARYPRRK
jgi:hypothetical protein